MTLGGRRAGKGKLVCGSEISFTDYPHNVVDEPQ